MFPGPPLRSALGIPVLRGGAEPSSSSHRKPSKTHASAGTSAWPLPWWAVGRTWWGALHSLLFPRAEPTGFSRSSFMSLSHVKTRTTLGQEQEMICARQGEVCAPRKQEPMWEMATDRFRRPLVELSAVVAAVLEARWTIPGCCFLLGLDEVGDGR